MNHKLCFKNEEQILDEGFRKKIIDEIVHSNENIARKNRELRRHEIYRDMNRKWVMEALVREGFKTETLYQMENRAANISIAKKVVNKKAATYVGGVTRKADIGGDQASLDDVSDYLNIDQKMLKWDRYRELFKNTLLQIVPFADYKESEEGEEKYDLMMKVLAPWQYDVIEDPIDHTKPRVVILTDFVERNQIVGDTVLGSQGYRTGLNISFEKGDRKEQVIADSSSDDGTERRTFIWWSDKYHFTTDEKGKMIDTGRTEAEASEFAAKGVDPKVANPIGELPFVNNAHDQDGNFWAEGGSDIPETSILINKLLTDLNYIMFVQGWGQLVIHGRDIPKRIVGGPDNAIVLEVKDGDPTPGVFYATSNPNIDAMLSNVKTVLAMFLTTNNLSTSSISANLDANDAQSGVASLIEQAESTADLQEQQNRYRDLEQPVWEKVRKWHLLYHSKKALVAALQEITPISSSKVSLKFHQVKPTISEKEKLEEIKLRQELKLNTKTEILRIDNPQLTDEEAEKKLAEIEAENPEPVMGEPEVDENGNPLPPEGPTAGPGKEKPAENEPNPPEKAKLQPPTTKAPK